MGCVSLALLFGSVHQCTYDCRKSKKETENKMFNLPAPCLCLCRIRPDRTCWLALGGWGWEETQDEATTVSTIPSRSLKSLACITSLEYVATCWSIEMSAAEEIATGIMFIFLWKRHVDQCRRAVIQWRAHSYAQKCEVKYFPGGHA